MSFYTYIPVTPYNFQKNIIKRCTLLLRDVWIWTQSVVLASGRASDSATRFSNLATHPFNSVAEPEEPLLNCFPEPEP